MLTATTQCLAPTMSLLTPAHPLQQTRRVSMREAVETATESIMDKIVELGRVSEETHGLTENFNESGLPPCNPFSGDPCG